MAQSLEQMGEDIRVQGGQGSGNMTELIYNPVTGEFETVPVGTRTNGDRSNVTDMTKDGFAKV